MDNRPLDWLIRVEDASARLCEIGAAAFSEDFELSSLLTRFGEEEKTHHDVLCTIRDFLAINETDTLCLKLGDDTRRRIEERLSSCERMLRDGNLERGALLSLMVDIEFSELSEMFLSIIDNMRGRCGKPDCQRYELYRHRLTLQRYIETLPDSGPLLDRIKRASFTPVENILVVDDNEIAVEYMSGILGELGRVEGAGNGQEAIGKITERYYGAVISDIEMPVMNGMELFNTVVGMFPGIRDRFIFFTTSSELCSNTCLQEAGPRCLEKPSSAV
jgi:CheY-like chemotaxis protein